MTPLFEDDPSGPRRAPLEEGAVLLRGFASLQPAALLEEVERIAEAAPFWHLETPTSYA
jgi:alkylated DNA repair protein (DNA oxidative demethylase)